MATLKISQLSEAVTGDTNDLFMIVQNGVNKKTKLSTILSNLNSSSNISINPLHNSVNFNVSTAGNANTLFVDGTNNRVGIKTSTPNTDFEVNGSIRADVVYLGSVENVAYGGTIVPLSVIVETSLLSVSSSPAPTNNGYTIADGADGQTKYISLVSMSGATEAYVTFGTNKLVGAPTNKIKFTAIGQGVALKYCGAGTISKWICIGNNGATIL